MIRLKYNVVQSSLLHAADKNFLKGVLLLDSNEKLHVFPEEVTPVVVQHAKSTFLFIANSESGLIKGYTLAYSTAEVN